MVAQYRVKKVEQTYADIKPLLAEMGITRVANITGLDNIGIPVATSIRPNSKHLSVSQGKGTTLINAKVSAMMESIEGYHAENPPETVMRGSFNALQERHVVIEPNFFRRQVFRKHDLHDIEFDWIEALELHSKRVVHLPKAVVMIDSTHHQHDHSFFEVSSNGLAAGNTYQEALAHALYEVIERDSLVDWQNVSEDMRLMTQININSINSVHNKALLEKLVAAKQAIKIWDISSKFKLPAFHCAIATTDVKKNRTIYTGTGAHINKHIALSRAVTEAVQGRLTVISGNRDDIFPEYYHTHMIQNEGLPDDKKTPRNFRTIFQPKHTKEINNHIEYMQEALHSNGIIDAYVVNHTKKQLGVPVVQVFIPELRFNGIRF